MPSKMTPMLVHKLQSSRPSDVLGVLVRTRQPIDETQRATLQGLGIAISTEAGSVLTCRGPVAAIPALEGLDFIVSIDFGTVRLS